MAPGHGDHDLDLQPARQTGGGRRVIKARAADDSANIGAPPPGTRVDRLDPCSARRDPADTGVRRHLGAELGVKLVPQTDGFIKGVRFYKGTGNTGTHTGGFWSENGDLLAGGTFTARRRPAGRRWCSARRPGGRGDDLRRVVQRAERALRRTTTGRSPHPHVAAPLTAPRSTAPAGNGVVYGPRASIPSESYNATNYYVDVLFDIVALTRRPSPR